MERPLDAGLSEIARFLAARAPFDALAPEELGEVVTKTEIEFYPAGAAILTEDGGPVTFLRVVHSGGVDISHEGRLLDLLGVGDAFGHAAMLSGLPPGFEARAAEDTLCYRIPVEVARPLLERASNRELLGGVHEPGHQPVAELLRAAVVRCEPMTAIREVARRMTAAGASCAVVEFQPGHGFGIVTDRDIRTKIVAGGMPVTAAVAVVMTTPAFSVTPDRLGGEVLFEMLERGIRHALVVSERGQLIGVVDDADLFAVQPRSWFGVRRAISRSQSADALVEVARRLPELVVDLHASNLRAPEIARVLSALADALTARALALTAPGFELPTAGLVWVAVGSQARRELTPASSPRAAIVYSDVGPPPGWADAVTGLLKRCGMGVDVEARATGEWTRAGEDEVALGVLIERRALWGTPRDPLPVAVGPARDELLATLRRRALAYSPPTGFDAESVLERDGTRLERLDIRRAAVVPIVELGRWAGAAAGLVEGSTTDKLAAGAASGELSDSDARMLAEAFELALDLRIGHHMEQLSTGARPDDQLDPAAISPLTRDHLRDVFRAIAGVQRRLAA
ncbi:MAG TPA: putative nucleotidyltransferase substrate binding domain-containing protein [Solirubrobacteraceae bacterium]|jgi:CBS domain-containing protein|nr:putative nucleotidyltransferase substrate binding domain-containing protein [Solirubrobacteraceae bacterium]